MNIMRCTIGTAALLAAICAVSDSRFKEPRIDRLIVAPAKLEVALQLLADKTHLPFGVEILPAAHVKTEPSSLDLSGFTSRQAIDRLLVQTPGYERRSDRIVVIRPRTYWDDTEDWLNRRFSTFEITRLPVREALHAVHRLFDPGYNPSPMPARVLDNLRRREALNEAVMKPISISLKNAAVWEMLNAIVEAHGNLSWVVDYRGNRPTAADSRIQVVSWDRWTIGATGRPGSASAAATTPSRHPTVRPGI